MYDTHRFVSQGQVLSRADGTAYCMGVRGTNEGSGRSDNRVVWTWMGNGFLHEAHLTDSFHYKSFHARSFLFFASLHQLAYAHDRRTQDYREISHPVGETSSLVP